MSRFLLASVLMCWMLTVPLRAQTDTSSNTVTIATDRPAVAASSIVVPQGAFQAENGLQITNQDGNNSLDLPETNLRYGLLAKTELRLEVPDYYYNLPFGSSNTSGFGDLAAGVKQQFGPIHGFEVSAIIFVSFPTGANGISSHGYDPGLQLPWSRSLSTNWTLGGQVAFYWPTVGAQRNFTGQTSFYLDRQLSQRWDAFVEYAGDFPEHGGSQQILHFGTAYKLTPHQQIDFHVAVGLTNAAPHAYVGFGYSFLILPKGR
ncbi:MAG TPA: transporter [Candidatus Sulfotelmatobacter sp.]|nr:transporter [Candidatus Sulfotelmatobacter sp.]